MSSLKETSNFPINEYILKFKGLKHSLVVAGYTMGDVIGILTRRT